MLNLVALSDITKARGLEILLALREGAKNFSELANRIGGSYSTTKERTDELNKLGIIKRRKSNKFPFEDTFELTLKGYMLAKLVEDLRERAMEKREEKTPVIRVGEDWILAALYALGGKIKGKTRLQKLFFLAKEEFGAEHPYKFSKSSYGPFCKEIETDIEELERKGFIIAERVFFDPIVPTEEGLVRVDYALTNTGKIIAKKELDKLPSEAKDALLSLKRYQQMSLDNLVKYVHSRYPEYQK